MDKEKQELNEEQSSLKKSLGQPFEIDCFLDGKARKAFPISLADYAEFVEYIRYISPDDVVASFFNDNGYAIKSMIAMVFLEDDVEDILQNVDATNYPTFIREVYEIQGLKLEDNKGSDNKKK